MTRETEAQLEIMEVDYFVMNNKYKSEMEMERVLGNNLELLSEFNYDLTKRLYENIVNEEVVKEMGNIINERGGFQAMQATFYIVTMGSPWYKGSRSDQAYYAVKYLLNKWWDGIGKWQC